MKKILSIASFLIVNVTLFVAFLETFNPFQRNIGFLITRPEFFFSPSPVYNIIMTGSMFGLIAFNLNLILNRKNKKS